MSKSEDDLREFVRVLEALAQEAKSPSDLNAKLLSDASARLADASARATMEIKEASRRENNHFVLTAVQCLKAQWNVIRFGPELSDSMARGLVDGMVSNKQLSLKQRRLVNLYRMICFRASGGIDLVFPERESYKRAAAILTILSIMLLLTAVAVWAVVSELEGGLFIAYSLGALIGYLLRAAYDFAWGRENTAAYLRSRIPWVRICRQN